LICIKDASQSCQYKLSIPSHMRSIICTSLLDFGRAPRSAFFCLNPHFNTQHAARLPRLSASVVLAHMKTFKCPISELCLAGGLTHEDSWLTVQKFKRDTWAVGKTRLFDTGSSDQPIPPLIAQPLSEKLQTLNNHPKKPPQ
jgi:hypothetical protein